MLSAQDNIELTRVGADTPMGQLLRCYWQPVLLSSELADPDGAPVPVRVLGEDLVAFRDSDGRVGLLGARCPHRNAPLCFGRNEERGLRCIYHGWKFAVDGRCVDIPNLPPDSAFKEKIRQTAYPVVERNGFVLAYLGAALTPPPLPRLDFLGVPREHLFVTKQLVDCNFVQPMEGDFDPVHIAYLHATTGSHGARVDAYDGLDRQIPVRGDQGEALAAMQAVERLGRRDHDPVISVVTTDYGMLVGARRDPGPDCGEFYWRLNQLIMPFYAYVPGVIGSPVHCNAWVPIDDHTTMAYRIQYYQDRQLTEQEVADMNLGLGAHVKAGEYCEPTPAPGSAWVPKAGRSNQYGWSREAQDETYFAGIEGIWKQDRAVTEGMGAIADRTREHLLPSDVGVVRLRRRLLAAAREVFDNGATPPGLHEESPLAYPTVRLTTKDTQWEQLVERIHGRPYRDVALDV